mgnify:CR=1 FL=1
MLSEKALWLSEAERIASRKIVRHIYQEALKILTEMKYQPCNRIYIADKINRIQKDCIFLNSQISNFKKEEN